MNNYLAVIGTECCGGPPNFVKLMQNKSRTQYEFTKDIEGAIGDNEFIASLYIIEDGEVIEIE